MNFAKVDGNCQTFLSRNVHQLICKYFEQLDTAARIDGILRPDCNFIEDGHLVWDKIREILGQGINNSPMSNTIKKRKV